MNGGRPRSSRTSCSPGHRCRCASRSLRARGTARATCKGACPGAHRCACDARIALPNRRPAWPTRNPESWRRCPVAYRDATRKMFAGFRSRSNDPLVVGHRQRVGNLRRQDGDELVVRRQRAAAQPAGHRFPRSTPWPDRPARLRSRRSRRSARSPGCSRERWRGLPPGNARRPSGWHTASAAASSGPPSVPAADVITVFPGGA